MTGDAKKSQAALYLEMAEKMSRTAAQATDPQVAATYLALAGQWTRLAEAAGWGGDNDDLPARLDDDEMPTRPGPSAERRT